MAIDFSNSSQQIDWGAYAPVQNLANKTLLAWVYKDANVNGNVFGVFGSGANERYAINLDGATGKYNLTVRWSGATAQWVIDTAPSTGAWHLIGFTYNNSSTTNDPVAYVDGVSVAFTETVAPSGTYANGTTNTLDVGSAASIDGRVATSLIYNVILSATEWADAFASKLAIPTARGLVFAPQLWQRGEVGQGGTLTASHTISDWASGGLGTPSGSPLFSQDTYLTFNGLC